MLDNVAAANYQEQENAISFLASTQYSNRSMQYCTSQNIFLQLIFLKLRQH